MHTHKHTNHIDTHTHINFTYIHVYTGEHTTDTQIRIRAQNKDTSNFWHLKKSIDVFFVYDIE